MKKLLCMLIACVLCLSLAAPAYAAEPFVPSITYKDGPDIKGGTMNGETVTGCLVVTSIAKARNKSTDITQAERDLLLELYEKLDSGEMKLPIANDEYVVRELVDVSFAATACVDSHSHEEWLAKDDTTVTVDFDLGVKSGTEVIVLVYVDEQWVSADKVTNKGNGVVSVVFEDIGPVAFCVDPETQVTPPKTGDTNGADVLLWGGILIGSVAALLILIVLFKRSRDDEEEER